MLDVVATLTGPTPSLLRLLVAHVVTPDAACPLHFAPDRVRLFDFARRRLAAPRASTRPPSGPVLRP